MPRKLQHIAWSGAAERAQRDGEKVTTLCGKRVYQMPNMKDEIPTCSVCAHALMTEHKKLVLKAPTYTFTVTTSSPWIQGGASR